MELAMLAIRPLLPKLGDLLTGEFTLEKRVRKGVDTLDKELHAALGKVAKVPPDELDEGVKIWQGCRTPPPLATLAHRRIPFLVVIGPHSQSPHTRFR